MCGCSSLTFTRCLSRTDLIYIFIPHTTQNVKHAHWFLQPEVLLIESLAVHVQGSNLCQTKTRLHLKSRVKSDGHADVTQAFHANV